MTRSYALVCAPFACAQAAVEQYNPATNMTKKEEEGETEVKSE